MVNGKKGKDVHKKSSPFIERLANLIIKIARPDYELYKEGLDEDQKKENVE